MLTMSIIFVVCMVIMFGASYLLDKKDKNREG